MSDEKPKIVEVPTIPAQANASTVRELRDWLAAAEAGHIVSIAMCGLTLKGKTWTFFSATNHFAALTGAIELMQYRRLKQFVEDTDSTAPEPPKSA